MLIAPVVIAALAFSLSAVAPTSDDETFGGALSGDAAEVAGQVDYHHDAGPKGPSHNDATDTTPASVYTRVPACTGNDPNRGLDGFCQDALDACTAPEIMYWLFVGPAGSTVGAPGWRQYGQRCLGPTDPAPPVVLPAMSLADFQRLPLPAGTSRVQPDNGYTLINIETNVFAEAEPVTLNTTLLGFPVQVRATPSRYAWDFGDGQRFGPTEDPGEPYPALRITNTYTAAGVYAVTLTTYYTGEYSVAGGPFLPIVGEARVDSPTVQIEALAGRNHLVANSRP